ncbi:folylpolyglutamate synthase/dihydrofolate synthase family protein [Pseudalkalibacillus sp. SCS-8]|uniref:bifunctional folylpolyglutamate synthase/dihydrofolate synthase n=1 Tax=Pseudalkalibacillus nanhaiensis TaxID=3115291 RepID=UPI0032DAD0DD
MMKTYEETMHWIHELLAFGMKPGLIRMEMMLDELGHPERKRDAIHIAGTNGKGSTLTYLRCMLEEAGYKVGTFTSPYIEQFNERISINGSPIDDDDLVRVANKVRPVVEKVAASQYGTPTEFEVITVIAFEYFANFEKPDLVILETGLGGRFDSTNVIQPILTGITNIGYDHTAILGDTLPEIAIEKSGIMKQGIPMVTGVEQAEALTVVEEQAEKKNVLLYKLGEDYQILQHQSLRDGERFSLRTPNTVYDEVTIGMSGLHQVKNAAMAITMLENLMEHHPYKVTESQMYQGLMKATWPGRFEKVSERPLIILDGAHNQEGVQSLNQTLISHYPNHTKRLIFSAMKDKPIDKMLSVLYDSVDHITFTSFDFPRASSARSLYDHSRFPEKDVIEDYREAIRIERNLMGENDILIITGSLYFISAVREYLKNENCETF